MTPSHTSNRTCRECGCGDDRACVRVDELGLPETCAWVEVDLCSACTPDAEPGWLHPADQPSFTPEEIIHAAHGEYC